MTDTGQDTQRAGYTAGLRALADLLDTHPELTLPTDGRPFVPLTVGLWGDAERRRMSTRGNRMQKATEWLGIEQLAQEIGVPVRTIYAWRHKGTGPRGATFGKHVRFRRSDVEAWIANRLDKGATTR